MLESVHHIHYIVRSRDRFIDFMERAFGVRPDVIDEVRESGLGSGNKDAVYQIADTLLEVTEPAPNTPHARFLEKHGPRIWHVAWRAPVLEQTVEHLKSVGIRTAAAPLDIRPFVRKGVTESHWGYKHVNLDPDDTEAVHIQLAEGPATFQSNGVAQQATDSVLKRVHHLHFIVEDRDRLLEVISRGFGTNGVMLEDRKGGLGDGNKDGTLKVGNALFEISAPTTGPTKTLHGRVLARHGPGVYHVAWAVDDIDAVAARLEAAGIRTSGGPVDIMGEHTGVSKSHWGYQHVNINPEYSEGVHFQLAEGKADWDQ